MPSAKTEKKTTSKVVAKKTATPKVEQPTTDDTPATEPLQTKNVKTTKAQKASAKPAPKGKSATTSKVVKAVKDGKASTAVKAPKNLKVAKKTVKSAKAQNTEDDDVDEPGKRYFKCIMINSEGVAVSTGRYSGKKPKQAASKACTRLFEEQKETGNAPEQIVFGMHESTRASKKKKKYFYVGRRVDLEEPEEVPIHMRDPVTNKVLKDKNGEKIPKIDPKTGKPMIIKYYHNNDVRKLTDLENCQEYPLLFNYDAKEEEEQAVPVAKKLRVVKKGEKKTTSKAGVKAGTKKAASKTVKTTKVPVKKQSTDKKAVVKKETNVKVKKNVTVAKTGTKVAKTVKN